MESLGRKEVVGALEKLEVLLGLVCGRRLERNGIQPSLTLSFLWGMEEGYVFGRMFDARMRLYVILSPLYFLWQLIKMSWWQMCERKGFGPRALLDLLMIGRWMRP